MDFLFKDLLLYLRGRVRETDQLSWPGPKPRVYIFIQVSYMVYMGPVFGPLSAAFTGRLARWCTRSGVVGTQTGIHMGCGLLAVAA